MARVRFIEMLWSAKFEIKLPADNSAGPRFTSFKGELEGDEKPQSVFRAAV